MPQLMNVNLLISIIKFEMENFIKLVIKIVEMRKIMSKDVQHVFLVGAKSLGSYGGYETFIDKLTEYHQNNDEIKYHVACKANGEGAMDESTVEGAISISKMEFIYHNAHCFKIKIPNLGSVAAINYDIAALKKCCEYIKKNNILNPIVYIMACRIGPFVSRFYKQIHKLGGRVYLNPDGHEWMRSKWSMPVRIYWKISEQIMVKYSDLVICDSANIEQYIHKCYNKKGLLGRNPETTFIAYGAETRKSKLCENDPVLLEWYKNKKLEYKNYYLIVGRFVPENNYETMIREFMLSNSQKALAIITNVNEKLLRELEKRLGFRKDNRIKFVGTVYNQELLMKIRENAFGYFHGHEVGGTNPSLLESLGSTNLNLLLDIGFNREVAENAALYWNKNRGDLAALIDRADVMEQIQIEEYGKKSKQRIINSYSWKYICEKYEQVFVK